MAPFPWECILYPVPILLVAYGLQSESAFGKLIGLAGAVLWFTCLGWEGTCIAVASLVGWWIIIVLFRVLFTPRDW